MGFRIFDPTDAASGEEFRRAPRGPLAGRAVGLLDNGKVNADRFLDAVGDLLRAEHGVRDVVRVRKPSPYRAAPDEALDALAKQVDLAVVGIGD
jgi:hypothetical protein